MSNNIESINNNYAVADEKNLNWCSKKSAICDWYGRYKLWGM